MPNFVKIGQSVAKILRFFIFQDGGCRHLGCLKLWILICWRYLEGPDAPLYQSSSKSVVPLRRYCDFSNFQDGRRRHLGFLKSRSFIHYWGPELRHASACQILLKSVNRLRRVEVVPRDVCEHLPYLTDCHSNVPWVTAKCIFGKSSPLMRLPNL